jgi:hypothetical protein
MTLILTFTTSRFIVQASDRRLTYPNGALADDSSNKPICVSCRDAFIAFGYLLRTDFCLPLYSSAIGEDGQLCEIARDLSLPPTLDSAFRDYEIISA